ncbi:MGA_1079 family surface serine endopeptidase [Mycoplasma sp. 1018B]|uniref:MGA_1079 family surface serine endopeptidase n=1 Tax=Mycoplasma sp. 1018B TaxID=2967302 RepID=UPI00211C5D9F|nr:lipoprotein 17-related variable surface protein [Mycoplasma sp. 1018B]UUM19435.1 lipoprotein 17-related variable surface protein [Mycoplasma sp. 1018B]
MKKKIKTFLAPILINLSWLFFITSCLNTSNNSDDLAIFDNLEVEFDYLNKENVELKDLDKNQIKLNSKDKSIYLTNLKIISLDTTLGQVIFNYQLIKKDNAKELYSKEYTYTLTGFKINNDDKLNIELPEIVFDYSNKENTFIENATIDNIIYDIAKKDNYLYKIANLKIKNKDFFKNAIEIEYLIQIYNQENNLIYTSDILTSTIKDFLTINNFDKQITERKNYLNNLVIEFDYPNKNNVKLDQINKDQITNNLIEDNIQITNLEIINKNENEAQITIEYYLKTRLNNQEIISSKKIVQIKDFWNENKAKSNLEKQINDLSNLVQISSKNYQLLPSQIQKSDLFWSNYQDNYSAELIIEEIKAFNDLTGELTIAYKLKSQLDSKRIIFSDLKTKTFNNFNSLTNLKNQKEQFLNQLIDDSKNNKYFVTNKNLLNTKASQISKNDLFFTMDYQDDNIKTQIKKLTFDDNLGQLNITYELVYQDPLFSINSKETTFILNNFLTNDQSNKQAIQKEQERLNNLNLVFNYNNQNNVYALDTQVSELIYNNLTSAKVINLEIITKNNELGQIIIKYRLQSNKKEFSNLISNEKTFILNNFKKGLLLEQLIKNKIEELNQISVPFDYPNKNNTSVENVQLEQITYQVNDNFKIQNLHNLQIDKENDTISFNYEIVIDNFYNQVIKSQIKVGQISNFHNEIKTQIIDELTTYLANYDLKLNQALIDNYNLKLYSTTINENNAFLYLNLKNDNDIDLKISNLDIDLNKLNTLKLNLVATKDNVSLKKEFTLDFTNDLNERLNQIQINNVNDLYNVDVTMLNYLHGKNLVNNLEIVKKAFSKKNNKINDVFDFEIDWNNVKTKIENKQIKWYFNINIYQNNHLLKKIENLTLEASNNILWTYFAKENDFTYDYQSDFQNYLLNQNKSTVENYLINAFKKMQNNDSQFANLTWENLKENNNINQKIWKNLLHNAFNFAKDWTLENLINFDNNLIFKKVDNNNFFFLANIKNNKTNQEKIYPLVINDIFIQNDNLALSQLLSWIKNDDYANIWINSYLKTDKLGHEYYYAKDIYDQLNDLYQLPKAKEYSLKILDSQHTDKLHNNSNLYNENDGTAIIQIGLFKNDIYTNIKTKNHFTLRFFKTYDYEYHLPKERWFNDSDFENSNYVEPHAYIKGLVDKLNSRNFNYNFVQGIYSPKDASLQWTRRTVDAQLIIQQQAFKQLHDLLVLTEDNSKKINKKAIYNNTDSLNNVKVDELTKAYFIYYYDVESTEKDSLSFKIGLIKKDDPKVRYHTKNKIKLVNLKNDYQLDAYPSALLNSLTLDDLEINQEQVAKITFGQFLRMVRENKVDKSLFKIKSKYYHNFTFDNWENVQIDKVQFVLINRQYRLFFNLKYKNFDQALRTSDIIGETWYEIDGFKNFSTWEYNDANFKSMFDKLSVSEDMKKVFLANGKILRQRKINANTKDLIFEIDNNQEKVNWIFKKTYYEPLLINQKVENAKLLFHFYTNLLYLDNNHTTRIVSFAKGLNVELDWNELQTNGFIKQIHKTDLVNNEQAEFEITFTLKDDGIHFEYRLINNENKQYKIVGDNFAQRTFAFEANKITNKFDKNQAVYFNTNLGASITIQYQSDIANETFSQYQSNLFDYQNMSTTLTNTPFYLYNPAYNHGELFKYNPNETLSYKWHEGYKLALDYMHLSYNDERIKKHNQRAIGFRNGSALLVSKLSDDINDARFVFLTNNHVTHNNNTNEDPTVSSYSENFKFTTANNYKEIKSGDYGGGIHVFNSVSNAKGLVFWTGVKQYDNQGILKETLGVDLTAFTIDLNDAIKKAKSIGRLSVASEFEQMKKLKDLNFASNNKDNIFYFLNIMQEVNKNFKEDNATRWINKPIISTNRFATGFPRLLQTGYIVNRNTISDNKEIFGRSSTYYAYTPVLFRGGTSGTGIVDEKNNYILNLNSAEFYNIAVGFVNYSKLFNNQTKEWQEFNFFGFANSIEELSTLKNKNSLAANLIKLNTYDPSIALPKWMFKKHKLNQ